MPPQRRETIKRLAHVIKRNGLERQNYICTHDIAESKGPILLYRYTKSLAEESAIPTSKLQLLHVHLSYITFVFVVPTLSAIPVFIFFFLNYSNGSHLPRICADYDRRMLASRDGL